MVNVPLVRGGTVKKRGFRLRMAEDGLTHWVPKDYGAFKALIVVCDRGFFNVDTEVRWNESPTCLFCLVAT